MIYITNNIIIITTTITISAAERRGTYQPTSAPTPIPVYETCKSALQFGRSSDGVNKLSMSNTMVGTDHYCLQNSSYAGGGWTLLLSQNDPVNFAPGSNYAFDITVGDASTGLTNDYGLDRRGTFVPIPGDEFLLRREDTKDWVRFVVSIWSPTYNNVANGWDTTKDTSGGERSHPHWAKGKLYNSKGQLLSGYEYFNGCALGGSCYTSNSDGVGFGKAVVAPDIQASSGGVYGGGYDGSVKARFYWGTSTEVTNTRFTYWYRPATSLLDSAMYLWNFNEPSGTRYDSKQRTAITEVYGTVSSTQGFAPNTNAAYFVGTLVNSTNRAHLQIPAGVLDIGSSSKSISIRFKLTRNDVGIQWLLVHGSTTIQNFVLYLNSDNSLCCTFSKTLGSWGDAICKAANSPPTINVWHNAVITAGTGMLSFYFDGVLVGFKTYTGSISGTGVPHLIYAYKESSPLYSPASFAIDQLGVFNRVLSADEVSSLYYSKEMTSPTLAPTVTPTLAPTASPSLAPTRPTVAPTLAPTTPTVAPTAATTLLDTAQYLWNLEEASGTRYDSKQGVAITEVGGSVLATTGYAGTSAANIVSTDSARLQVPVGVFDIGIILILITIIIIIITIFQYLGSSSRSVSIRFKFSSALSGGWQWLVVGIDSNQGGFTIYVDSGTNKFSALFRTEGGHKYYSTNIIPTANVWHHAVITFGSGSFSLYYDGAVVATDTYSGPILDSPDGYSIGYHGVGKTTTTFAIDQVASFNKVLTASEVATLYST